MTNKEKAMVSPPYSHDGSRLLLALSVALAFAWGIHGALSSCTGGGEKKVASLASGPFDRPPDFDADDAPPEPPVRPAPRSLRTWTQATAAAPWSARTGHTSVVFRDKIWVLGGNDYGSKDDEDSGDAYREYYRKDVWSSADGVNWTLETAAAPWSGRDGHTSVVFHDKIWVIGGFGGARSGNDVWSSEDGTSWTCETAAAPWSGRSYHTSAVFRDKIWVIGGSGGTSSGNDVWSSENGTNWICETAAAPRGGQSVVFRDRLWVLGEHDVWSTANGTDWTQEEAAAAWNKRSGYTSAMFHDRLWVLGGRAENPYTEYTNDVWSTTDGRNGTQESVAAPWTGRVGHTSVVFHDQLWVLGGGDWSNDGRNDVWFMTDDAPATLRPQPTVPTPQSGQWTQETAAMPWSAHSHYEVASYESVVFKGRIWILEGHHGSDTSQRKIWSSADGGVWVEEATAVPWRARYGFICVVFNDKLWVYEHGFDGAIWSSVDGVNWIRHVRADPFWQWRSVSSVVAFGDKLWILGGYCIEIQSSQRYFNDVWSSTDGVHWTQETDAAPWQGRWEHISIGFNNRLWVIGGENAGSTDAWSSSDGINWVRECADVSWLVRRGRTGVVFKNRLWVLVGSEYGEGNDVWSSSNGVDWTQATADAPWNARWHHSCVVFKDKLWLFGSWDIWSTADGMNWTHEGGREPWLPRTGYAGVVFNNRLWMIGGSVLGLGNDIWSSANGKTWTREIADAPWRARVDHGCVVFNNRLWVLGGTGENGELYNDVWSSSDGVNWVQQTASAPWSPRHEHTSVVFRDRLWVLGGEGKGTVRNNDVWSSSDGKRWVQESAAAPWRKRHGHASVVFRDRLWVIGGNSDRYKNDVSSPNDVWSTADGAHWTRECAAAPWGERSRHAVVVFNDRIWVLGGYYLYRTEPVMNDVWSSPDGVNWVQELAAPWSPRAGHNSVVFRGRLWMLGGDRYDENDVWSFE